jgi:fatty-acyl-CoA synthase
MTSARYRRGGPEKPWIEVTTLGDLLDRQAQRHPDREALVFPDERVTHREYAARAERVARGLIALGVEQGDRVGVLLPSGVDYVAGLYGAIKIGAIPVPINARFKSFELRHIVTNSAMRVLLTSDSLGEAIDLPELITRTFPALPTQDGGDLALAEAPALRQLVVLGEGEPPGFLGRAPFERGADGVDPDEVDTRQLRVRVRDTAMILYTSGTTSAPKGAMLTHEGFVRFAQGIARSRMFLTPEDRLWSALPLFHIGGASYTVLCLSAGCTYCHVGFFRPDVALDQLERERCTVAIPAFETIWMAVLDHPRFPEADLSALRIVFNVGTPERLRQMQERVPHAVQLSGFGGTEATSHLAMSLPDDPLELRVSTGGHPLPGTEVRIVDPETGAEQPPNTPGEIVFRGWARFEGYFREPELTAQVIDEQGWFHSGDLGRMDPEGRLTFVGRLKDMLKVGGENVAAAEVEGFLLTHPAVLMAQVVGAADARYSEVPAAFVQLKPGASASEEEIIDFCRGRISSFKIPRYVRFVDEWPMSATKIRKYELRERIARELEERGITEAPKMQSV